MKIIVDTNKVFSAILYTNSQIARLLIYPDVRITFYSTKFLFDEIYEHRNKIMKITGYSENELERIIRLVTKNILFIDFAFIPMEVIEHAEELAKDIDIDDTDFIALTEFLNGKLWSGDTKLRNGLERKGWKNFITTNELLEKFYNQEGGLL